MKSKNNKDFIIDKFFAFILIFPFFEIEAISRSLPFKWEYFVLFDFLFMLILWVSNLAITLLTISILLLYAPIIISTFLNKGDVFSGVYYMIFSLTLVFIFEYYKQRNLLHFILNAFKIEMKIIISINLFFQFYNQDFFGFTHAGNHVNFFASDNFLCFYYIPFIMIVLLTSKNEKGINYELLLWITICLISIIRAWSATGIVVFIIYIFLLYFRNTFLISILNPIRAVIINLVLSILIIFFNFHKHFSWLIVNILHKDLTLSHRTFVWKAAIRNIIKSPLIGYGTVRGGRMAINKVNTNNIKITAFSHNIFLELLIQGGIIALITFILVYYIAGKQIDKNNNYRIILSISIFTLLFLQFSEFSLYLPITNIPLYLCFFIDDFLIEKKNYYKQKEK